MEAPASFNALEQRVHDLARVARVQHQPCGFDFSCSHAPRVIDRHASEQLGKLALSRLARQPAVDDRPRNALESLS